MRNKIILVLFLVTVGVTLKLMFPEKKDISSQERESKISEELKEFPGKDIFSAMPQLLIKNEKSFYTAGELQKLIQQDSLVLDKDVYLSLGIFIETPVTISSDSSSRKKIFAYDNSVMFSIFTDDVVFENIDFYLTNITFFAQGRDDKLKRSPKNLKFINCSFNLYGRSSLNISFNNLTIEKSFFNNHRKTFLPESSFLWITGENITVDNNTFVNFFSGIHYPIFIAKSSNVLLKNNVIISYQEDLKGLVTVSESKDVVIENNILEDINFNPKSLALGVPSSDDEEVDTDALKFLDGSVAIWVSDSETVTILDNLWGVANIEYNQNLNEGKKNPEISWVSNLSSDFVLNCGTNDKFLGILKNNSYLKCQKR